MVISAPLGSCPGEDGAYVAELFAGRYELVDPLGQGGMGSVWRAWDHKYKAYVAAKLLRHADSTSLLRFVREHTSRIDHPHVVTPSGFAGEDDRVLFTMALVHGGSAETLLREFGTLPADWVAVLLDQLLDALGAVHALGLVHRDLKPSNLLLDPTGHGRPNLRVTDFGLAAQVGEPPRLTRATSFVGTPGYLSPEQARGDQPDPRQDLFACGVVAAELLRGKSPKSPNGVPPPLESEAPLGIPAPLWAVLRRLTAPSADDRPADATIARADLTDAGVVPESWPPAVRDEIEVVDQLPAFPPGWGPEGPGTEAPAAAVAEPVEVPAEEPVEPPVEPVAAEAVGHTGEVEDTDDGEDVDLPRLAGGVDQSETRLVPAEPAEPVTDPAAVTEPPSTKPPQHAAPLPPVEPDIPPASELATPAARTSDVGTEPDLGPAPELEPELEPEFEPEPTPEPTPEPAAAEASAPVPSPFASTEPEPIDLGEPEPIEPAPVGSERTEPEPVASDQPEPEQPQPEQVEPPEQRVGSIGRGVPIGHRPWARPGGGRRSAPSGEPRADQPESPPAQGERRTEPTPTPAGEPPLFSDSRRADWFESQGRPESTEPRSEAEPSAQRPAQRPPRFPAKRPAQRPASTAPPGRRRGSRIPQLFALFAIVVGLALLGVAAALLI